MPEDDGRRTEGMAAWGGATRGGVPRLENPQQCPFLTKIFGGGWGENFVTGPANYNIFKKIL